MKSIINLFQKLVSFPAIWVGVIYLFWWILIPVDKSFFDGIVFLVIYLTVMAAEKMWGVNKLPTIIFLVILLSTASFFSVVAIDLWFSTVGWLRRELIYIPLIILFAGYAAYQLFRQTLNGNRTVYALSYVAMFPILAVNIAYPVTYFPKVLDQKQYGNFRFYLVWGMDANYRSHLSFYKCKKWSARCEQYRTYFPMSFDKIIIDEEKNEVSAIDSNLETGLGFTCSDNCRSYEPYPAQLGDQVYQLSTDHDYESCKTTDCDVYVYTVYECDLDYTSCDPLPVQYSAVSDRWIYLDVNEDAQKISAYDRDDTLIFTFGEHPICYVEGCVILDQ